MSSYEMEYPLAQRAAMSERAAFISRTYSHLAGAVLGFVLLEVLIFKMAPESLLNQLTFVSPMVLLVELVLFIGVGTLARFWAMSTHSRGIQYLGLAVYVALQALLLLPLLNIVVNFLPRITGNPTAGETVLFNASVLTLCVFGGLSAAALITRKDFSFLAPILCIAGFLMIGVCILGIFFTGFNMGLWYSFAGIALASGYILYDTSNVVHHYRTDQYVAAALALFASLAYLFFHVLRLLLILSAGSRD